MKRRHSRDGEPARYGWIIAILASLSLTCSSESEEPVLDLGSTTQKIAQAQCERLFECCTDEERRIAFSGVDVSSQASCEQTLSSYLSTFVRPGWEQALERNALVVEPGLESSCIEGLKATSCGELSLSQAADIFGIEACEGFLSPNLETSGFCREHFECKSGFCSQTPGSLEGTCKDPANEGDACLDEGCGPSNWALFCEDELCTPRRPVEAPCTRNDECISANCVASESASGACGAPALTCKGK